MRSATDWSPTASNFKRSSDAAQARPAEPAPTTPGYFDVPPAQPGAPLTVTWAGVTTLLIDDGDSALMTDGFFSRPSLLEVGRAAVVAVGPPHRRLPGPHRRRSGWRRCCRCTPTSTTRWIPRWSPSAPARRVVGGTSAAQVGRGQGLPEDRLVVVTPGEPITLGAYDVTLIESEHCPPDRFPGVITAPVVAARARHRRTSAVRRGRRWCTTGRRTGGC